jgi:hypothetical protein
MLCEQIGGAKHMQMGHMELVFLKKKIIRLVRLWIFLSKWLFLFFAQAVIAQEIISFFVSAYASKIVKVLLDELFA